MKSPLIKIVIFTSNYDRTYPLLNCLSNNKYDVLFIITDKNNIEKFKKINKKVFLISSKFSDKSIVKKFFAANEIDIIILSGFNKILPKEIFDYPKFGSINLHAGPVPKYRGGSPLNWQLINGENKIGLSILKVESGLDNGPILNQLFFNISQNTTINEIHKIANKKFPEMVIKSLKLLKKPNSLKFRKQKNENAIYWHQRNVSDGLIDWKNKTAKEVHNLVRAISKPYPGAFSFYKKKKIIILEASVCSKTVKGTPGRVLFLNKKEPIIICKDNGIKIKSFDSEFKLKNGQILEN